MDLYPLTNLILLWVGCFESVAVHIYIFMPCGTQQ